MFNHIWHSNTLLDILYRSWAMASCLHGTRKRGTVSFEILFLQMPGSFWSYPEDMAQQQSRGPPSTCGIMPGRFAELCCVYLMTFIMWVFYVIESVHIKRGYVPLLLIARTPFNTDRFHWRCYWRGKRKRKNMDETHKQHYSHSTRYPRNIPSTSQICTKCHRTFVTDKTIVRL